MGPSDSFQSCRFGQKPFQLGLEDFAPVKGFFDIQEDLGDPEEPHDQRHQPDAVQENIHLEGKPRLGRDRVHADVADDDPERRPSSGISSWSRRPERSGWSGPRTIRAKYSGGPNLRAIEASGGARKARPISPRVPAMKEPKAEIPRAGPARPLAGHLVPVKTGHDRGRLSGNVHQDRGRGSSVHGPVIDPGEHDDGGDRAVHGRWPARRREMAATGPRPGRTPTRVPIRTPEETGEKGQRLKGDSENRIRDARGFP